MSEPERFKTSAMVCGHRQIETFRAMCFLRSRRPHQLVADIVLDAIREAQSDPSVIELIRNIRRFRSGLSIVKDGS